MESINDMTVHPVCVALRGK